MESSSCEAALFGEVNWAKALLPGTPLLEILMRGTVMYLGLFVLLRVILKRQSSEVGIADLLVAVLIADAAQNGMADDYTSVTDGLLLVATIIVWSYAIDWLSYYAPWLKLEPEPVMLVVEGKMLRRNMRRELVSEADLMSQLRQKGIDRLEQVKSVRMESDGEISIVKRSEVG